MSAGRCGCKGRREGGNEGRQMTTRGRGCVEGIVKVVTRGGGRWRKDGGGRARARMASGRRQLGEGEDDVWTRMWGVGVWRKA